MPDSSDTDLGVGGHAAETQRAEQYRVPVVIEGEGVEIVDLPRAPASRLSPRFSGNDANSSSPGASNRANMMCRKTIGQPRPDGRMGSI